ncbi:hypothetical protein [Paraconexibacter sp. AEG42_29]
MPSRPDMRLMGALGVFAVGVALAQSVAGLDAGLLLLTPAIVLFLPLLAGRYVGEETLQRWTAAFVPRRRRAAAALAPRLGRAPRAFATGGGARLATAMSRRGPPRGVLAPV